MNCTLAFAIVALGVDLFVSPLQADELSEYGAHLSSECTTCHRSVYTENAAPSLDGQTSVEIVNKLASFKSGQRANAVMQNIAARLTEDEIEALAAHYSSLPRPAGCLEGDASANKERC